VHGQEDGIWREKSVIHGWIRKLERAAVGYKLEDGDRENETVEEGIGRTIPNIRILDLFQDFGPDCCMAFFVFVNAFGAQVEPLADAAGASVR